MLRISPIILLHIYTYAYIIYVSSMSVSVSTSVSTHPNVYMCARLCLHLHAAGFASFLSIGHDPLDVLI